MMRKYYTTFSEKNLTGNAGLVHLGRFAERLGLANMIERTLTIQRSANADYQVADAILMLKMGVLSGIKHMAHEGLELMIPVSASNNFVDEP